MMYNVSVGKKIELLMLNHIFVLCAVFILITSAKARDADGGDQVLVVNKFLHQQLKQCNRHKYIFVEESRHAGKTHHDGRIDLGDIELMEDNNNCVSDGIYDNTFVVRYGNISSHTEPGVLREICKIGSREVLVNPPVFILKTSAYSAILKAAETYFEEELKAKGSVFLHYSAWMILAENCDEIEEIFWRKHANLTLDNVAVVCKRDSAVEILTLMWRENRIRVFERVNYLDASVGDCCSVFPNTRYGFNGRYLRVVTREDGPFVMAVRNNPETNVPEYQGFLAEIFKTLAHSLNFTYSWTPKATEKPLNWPAVANMVVRGEMDISCSLWSLGWTKRYNVTVTKTIVLDRFTGVYKKVPHNNRPDFFMIFPFEPVAYAAFVGAIVYAALVYTGVAGVHHLYDHHQQPQQQQQQQPKPRHIPHVRQLQQNPTQNEKQQEKQVPLPNRHMCENPATDNPNNKDNTANGDDDTPTTQLHPVLSKLSQITSMTLILTVSIIQQFYLPRPPYMSSRLLVFMWSFAMVLYNALHTGTLVAQYVPSTYSAPFRTFEALVKRDDFRWGTVNGTELDGFLSAAENGTLRDIHLRNEKRPQLLDTNGEYLYDTLKHLIHTLEENFVLISFELPMAQIVEESGKASEYEFMKEPLLRADQGFIVPNGSEIGELISLKSTKLIDMGILQHIYTLQESHRPRSENTSRSEDADGLRRKLCLRDFQGLLILVTGLLFVSLVFIMCEVLYERMKRESTRDGLATHQHADKVKEAPVINYVR